MSSVMWVGFGFAALLIMFLIISFFREKDLTLDQRRTLRFLTSLCGGFAGGLITGEALFELSTNASWGSLSISGAAGFALFFAVWFTYDRAVPLPDGIVFSVPAGWSFSDAAQKLASAHGRVVSMEGFSAGQQSAVLGHGEVRARTMPEALRAIGKLAPAGTIPEYTVEEADSTLFVLSKRG